MTDIYKKRQQEFVETFFTVHEGCDDGFYACPKSEDYFGEYENKPIEERPCYCAVENAKPKVSAFHQASMEAVARELIADISDNGYVVYRGIENTESPKFDIRLLKAQLSSKYLKGEVD